MNKTLVIMAAGLGSRFGKEGAKQVTGIGPNGEMLMEYSVYDAGLAGFDRFIFIISPAMEDFFPDLISSRLSADDLLFAVQSTEQLPEWFSVPEGRTKPYGTVSAVLAAKNLLNGPFAVINADDFYGRKAFIDLSAALDELPESGEACMLTYKMAATLSDKGAVTRGICSIDGNGVLCGIDETRGLMLRGGEPCIQLSDGMYRSYPKDTPVSMNIFGFTPWILHEMESSLNEFLRTVAPGDSLKAEYTVPMCLDGMITSGSLVMKAIPTSSHWFGMTYQEDIESVRKELAEIEIQYR